MDDKIPTYLEGQDYTQAMNAYIKTYYDARPKMLSEGPANNNNEKSIVKVNEEDSFEVQTPFERQLDTILTESTKIRMSTAYEMGKFIYAASTLRNNKGENYTREEFFENFIEEYPMLARYSNQNLMDQIFDEANGATDLSVRLRMLDRTALYEPTADKPLKKTPKDWMEELGNFTVADSKRYNPDYDSAYELTGKDRREALRILMRVMMSDENNQAEFTLGIPFLRERLTASLNLTEDQLGLAGKKHILDNKSRAGAYLFSLGDQELEQIVDPNFSLIMSMDQLTNSEKVTRLNGNKIPLSKTQLRTNSLEMLEIVKGLSDSAKEAGNQEVVDIADDIQKLRDME